MFVYGFFAIFFGWAVIYSMIWPFFVRPRIVAYFKRELGPYGGFTMASFFRGRALYREIVVPEELTTRLGAAPLSSFGFSHDLYEQEVRWHAASAGLRTVEALPQGGHSSSAKESMQGVCTREARQGSYR